MMRLVAAIAALFVSIGTASAQAMPAGGAGHVAALLPDRSVLVLGGYGADDAPSAEAVLYGPDGVPVVVGPMGVARAYHTANQLRNGTVLSTTPDAAFRWDSGAQQWIFNINTKSSVANTTCVYAITLNDGPAISSSSA